MKSKTGAEPGRSFREPELERRRQELEANRARFEELIAGLSPAQLTWRPGAGRWSMLECIAHLNRANEAYSANAEHALRTAKERGMTGTGPFKHGWFMQWAIAYLDPDKKKMRAKAPGMFQPRDLRDPADELAAFREELDTTEARLHEADGLHLAKVKLSSPVSRFIRLSLGQFFEMHTVHDRRHIQQAERVKSAEGFPVS
ncbi:MAG: DinB family protein [Gemmatimonadetes bacterium]|nr:DinB family protein [Gemmatimonadota bacterium]